MIAIATCFKELQRDSLSSLRDLLLQGSKSHLLAFQLHLPCPLTSSHIPSRISNTYHHPGITPLPPCLLTENTILPRGSIQVLGWPPHATSTASLLHQQGLKVTYVLLSAAVQGSLLREAVGLAGGRMMRQVSIHGRSICPGLEMTGGMPGCIRRPSL